MKWKEKVFGATLLNLLIAGAVCFGAEAGQTVSEKSPAAGKSQTGDATRKDELANLRHKLAETEAELLKVRAENLALRRDLTLLNQEMRQLIENYQNGNEDFRQLQLILSDALVQGKVRGAGLREDQLNTLTDILLRNGEALALSAIEFSELAEKTVPDSDEGKQVRSELALAGATLRDSSRRFISIAGLAMAPQKLDKCRILAVNSELALAILPVGQLHGAFNGLLFYIEGKKPVTLKVVSVRPFVSAAVAVSGNIRDLAPGMEAVTSPGR